MVRETLKTARRNTHKSGQPEMDSGAHLLLLNRRFRNQNALYKKGEAPEQGREINLTIPPRGEVLEGVRQGKELLKSIDLTETPTCKSTHLVLPKPTPNIDL